MAKKVFIKRKIGILIQNPLMERESMEQLITIDQAETLYGTLTVPENKHEKAPGVLIIGGSGPVDRNGNAPGMKLNIYNQLASWLEKQGIASLRYDKRGTGSSEGDFLETGLQDLIEDASAAVRLLKMVPEIDEEKIFILGHSEGGAIAPKVAEKEKVHGLMALASSPKPLFDILLEQGESVEREISEGKGIFYRALKTGKVNKRMIKKQHKVLKELLDEEASKKYKNVNVKWFQEHADYDPREAFHRMRIPLIAVNGGKDAQVKAEDVSAIAQHTSGPVEAYVVEEMNHILRHQPEEFSIMKTKRRYLKQQNDNLSHELLDHLHPWLQKQIQ